MKAHVTLPGASGGMDAQVVDIGEVEREFQTDLPPLESLDMNMVTRAKTILFSTAKELAKGNRRRAAPCWSAPAELFLISASPSYFVGGTLVTRRHWVEEITKTAKKYTRAKRELVSVLVYAQRALHTPCSAHYSNGTLIDKRNGQKGMLGHTGSSTFYAPGGKTVSEGGDEHFSPNWHGFLRGRRREGAMLAQRCMGWHLTSLGKSHLDSLTDMSKAFLVHKERFFFQGHDGEFTCMVKHGLLLGRLRHHAFFSWAFDKTFKRGKMSHQTPPSMMLSAPLTALRGLKVDGSWSGFADDLFIKDELPDHTAESAKDIILGNALDETLAEDSFKQNLR